MDSVALWSANYTFNFYTLAPLIVGCLIFALGLAVLIRERASAISMAFFGTTSAGAVWLLGCVGMLGAQDPAVALTWARIEHLGVVFIPSMVYLFTLIATGQLYRFRVAGLAAVLISAAFVLPILFSNVFVQEVRRFAWGWYGQYGWLSFSFLAFFFGLMVISLLCFWHGYERAPTPTHRRRIRALLVGFGVAYAGSVDFLATYGIPVYPFGYFPVFLFALIIGNSIWRYHLVDITAGFAANQILKTMADGLLVIDREGVIRVANRAASALFGLPQERLLRQPIWSIQNGLFSMDRFRRPFNATALVHSYEMSYLTPKGERIILDVAASGIQDVRGEAVAVVCILRDVTERRRAEQGLRQAHEQLKRSHEQLQQAQRSLVQSAKMESVGRLAAGIAHEVKNPLAVVLQGLDYLEGHLPHRSSQVRMVLHDGRDAVHRADRVIRELLDFSSPQELELKKEGMNTLIEQALLLVKHELDRCRISVVKEMASPLPPVRADRNKMEQVFVNLFMNAVHAMPAGGTLTVRTSASTGNGSDPQDVTLEVVDTGSGIPPDKAGRVFEPFFTTKTPGRGTGLGLSVCKSIVEMHGGVIQVRNQEGGGVRAVIRLPVSHGDE